MTVIVLIVDEKLQMKDMQVDHIDSQYLTRLKGESVAETIDTLNPSCRQCNFYKGIETIEGIQKVTC